MYRLILILILFPLMTNAQTLSDCQRAAERNYPLIRQYDLIAQTAHFTIENIQKAWLPQISASAQVTLQSEVPSWPDEFQNIYQQVGVNMKGLKKEQYRIGINVNQTIFDGGSVSAQKEIARQEASVHHAETEAMVYKIRRRVNDLYFSLLLLEKQIQLTDDLQELLSANERKLESMYKQGTAAKSDYLTVKAERLKALQHATNMKARHKTLTRILGTFCGLEITNIEKPTMPAVSMQESTQHPELKTINAQLRLADAQEKALDTAIMPRLSAFAQGYYGYPGYNMFEDMISHRLSFNGLIGIRLSWNIGALYTRKGDISKIQLKRDMAETNRDLFLFNNRLEQIENNDHIEQYRQLMAADEEIVKLLQDIRRAAESKLTHGIIDANALVSEINSENSARVQLSIHELEMLKEMYNLQIVIGE